MNIILRGVVGSHAYGLANEDSDIDKLGIYVSPTKDILSLHKPKETICKTNPDITYHEVEKFIRLACKCNPTILELLYLKKYDIVSPEGQLLIDIKSSFLTNTIFNSYGGYAISQARKLNIRAYTDNELNAPLSKVTRGFSAKTSNRPFKHARHCLRLLQQGRQLLETGNLNVEVQNKDELMSLNNLTVQQLINKFEKEYKEFKNTNSMLPDKIEYNIINKTLLKIRGMN